MLECMWNDQFYKLKKLQLQSLYVVLEWHDLHINENENTIVALSLHTFIEASPIGAFQPQCKKRLLLHLLLLSY